MNKNIRRRRERKKIKNLMQYGPYCVNMSRLEVIKFHKESGPTRLNGRQMKLFKKGLL